MTIYSPPSMSYRHCNIWNYIITLFVSIFVSLSFAHFRASLQQLRTPTIQVCLPALKSFTVYHQRIATRKEFGYFIRWTRSIITNSLIEKLVVMPDSHFWMGAPVSFDGLITHLQSKHHERSPMPSLLLAPPKIFRNTGLRLLARQKIETPVRIGKIPINRGFSRDRRTT